MPSDNHSERKIDVFFLSFNHLSPRFKNKEISWPVLYIINLKNKNLNQDV